MADPMTQEFAQNDSHDWLGDAGEDVVRYLAARDGFDVFAGGKWTADAVLHDATAGTWVRIEVRSTDRSRRPTQKDPEKLIRYADVLAEVQITVMFQLTVTFCRLREGRPVRAGAIANPAPGELRRWLLQVPPLSE